MMRPSGNTIYEGVLSELINAKNQTLVTESGIMGGDLLPKAFAESTIKALEKQLNKLAQETDDHIDIRIVGSGKFAAETKFVFGDIDVVMKMDKPETISKIKLWVHENTHNVRDIDSGKHGDELDPETMGDHFSFLFPIHKDGSEHLTIGELRAILQARDGHTNWKQHHDERLKVQANLKNLDGKSGIAMVQIDVMRCLVHGVEMENLKEKAEKFVSHLEASKVQGSAKYVLFLRKFLDNHDIEDFEEHYEFLRTHGELQDTHSQQLLTALYYLREKGDHKDAVSKRFDNVQHRYAYHHDSLQLIYYIAAQLGVVLDDDSFTHENIQKLIKSAIESGVASDKLTPELLKNPAEAWETIRGKHKDQSKAHILANTKNKRPEEANPHALYRNFGSRETKKLT